jgi:hypothetical protein
MTDTRTHDTDRDIHRASATGLFLTALGALVLVVSLWMDWITTGPADSEANPASGYEADGVIPLLVFLAVGFTVSLFYARAKADRNQHRGLTLASAAVGLAGLLWTVAFAIDPISTIQYPDQNVTIEAGLWLGIIGTLLWTAGSYLLAKEPEGDVESRSVVHTATVREVHDHGHVAGETRGTHVGQEGRHQPGTTR